MTVTEQEARKLWCPSQNEGHVGWDETRCIASACMMWRREKDTYGDDYGKDIPDDRGFCGLGGRP